MPVFKITDNSGRTVGMLDLIDGLNVEPAEPQAPAAPPAPPAPPKMIERKVMTDAAGAFTYDDYKAIGWSDNALVSQGFMRIEMVPETPAPESTVHPSVEQAGVPEDWQPEVPKAPEPPAAPQPPAAPIPPSAPAPSAPAAPTPPAAKQPEPQVEHRVSDVTPPHIPGREFMLKGQSFENVQDKAGVWFDQRIHSVTNGTEPAYKQDGTFKKRKGLKDGEYEQILGLQSGSTDQGQGSAPAAPQAPAAPPAPTNTGSVPSAPTPPQAPPAPASAPGSVPPPPGGASAPVPPAPPQASNPTSAPSGPQTGEVDPDKIKALAAQLKDWGDEA